MKLEEQVCSLELAKRLKELGVKQESHFVWYANGDTAHMIDCPDGLRPMEVKTFSAFTVAELGEMLPEAFGYPLSSYKTGSLYKLKAPRWNCDVVGDECTKHEQCADTEADARAKMLVYLLENNLITL